MYEPVVAIVQALELSEPGYLVLLLLLLCSEILWEAYAEALTKPHVEGSEIPWKSSCKTSCQRQQNIAVELLYHS